jgi:hypothetical protein
MTRFLQILVGLFIAQILLVAVVFWPGDEHYQYPSRPLLASETNSIDKLVLTEGDQQLVLQKQDGKWQLPDKQKVPAAEGRVEELLQKVSQVQLTWPVATTASAQERFEVAENKYQRFVQLFAGDKLLSEFYLGSSPGFRRVHLRLPGENEIYSVNLNSYDLPARADDWLNKSLLASPEPRVIQGADYELRKEDDSWVFAAQDEEETPEVDAQKAGDLVRALTNLHVQGVADSHPEGEAIQLHVETETGKLSYEFIRANNDFFVRRNDQPASFRMSEWEFERITNLGRQQLAKQGDSENSSAQTESAVEQAPKS